MKHVKVNKKKADKATSKRGYQHADYATGFRAQGPAKHDALHPSVRPPDVNAGSDVVGVKGDKATGPQTGIKALLPQRP